MKESECSGFFRIAQKDFSKCQSTAICGDNSCTPGENRDNCEQDCRGSGTDAGGDPVNDPTLDYEPCQKPASSLCFLKDAKILRDDTQPSDECQSGVCVDIGLGGGKCGEVGGNFKGSGGIKVSPDQRCTNLGTAPSVEEFSSSSLNPCSWGKSLSKNSPCVAGWTVVAGLLLLFILLISNK